MKIIKGGCIEGVLFYCEVKIRVVASGNKTFYGGTRTRTGNQTKTTTALMDK